MGEILFGTAGIPGCAKGKSSSQAPEVLRDLGLDAMELEFVRSVRMGTDMAEEVGRQAGNYNISLSAHAPYYINLNSKEDSKIRDSKRRIMDSALRLHHAGGGNLVFHAGFYQDRSKKSSIDNVIRELTDVREQLDKNGMHDIILRPELTGKASQIGDEKELFYIASCVDRTLPCIDFSHYYARYCADRRFRELFRFIEDKADYYFKDMHCHISGIEFTHKGEKKHLTLTESCMPWKKLIGLLAEYDCNGTVICESPVLEEDALLMKHEYDRNKGMNKK